MTRYGRRLSSTNIYHIMIRGNERRNIFLDEDDKVRFIDTLKRMKENNEYDIIAYCLMVNHVHLLIKELKDPIQRTMKRIGVSYTIYFNKKYNRIGHLFQDRYKSEPIETDSYVLECARYIHNNPVKAGIVKSASEYKWSSFREILSDNKSLVDKDFLLEFYSNKGEKAKDEFINYTNQDSNEKFIDLDMLEIKVKKEPINQIEKVKEILKKHGEDEESFKNIKDKIKRNLILNTIKKESQVSIRDLAHILGISKDIIFRAK